MDWRPGSFTKNFSWGANDGLKALYDHIRVGFDNEIVDVPREVYRERVNGINRPDFIPLNFFLFNQKKAGVDHVVVDELVFQALTSGHSAAFDKLALFAFNFSHAGTWSRAAEYQRFPSLWATHYIVDRLAGQNRWQVETVTASDIGSFLNNSPSYKAETSVKVSTNLNFLYSIGKLSEFSQKRIERWWVDCLFLAIDRIVADRSIDGLETSPQSLPAYLLKSHFLPLTGPTTIEKTFAMAHLMSLYNVCGGKDRFSDNAVNDRVRVHVPDYEFPLLNDIRPVGAIHPTNPRILKSIPRLCGTLAESIGFEVIDAESLATFKPSEFIKNQIDNAKAELAASGVKPTMSAIELHKLTRES
jgi:hypothetical protein